VARATDILRGSVRRSIDAPARIEVTDASAAQVMPIHGTSIPGRMLDISAGGAQVLVQTFLPRATRVTFELAGAAAGGRKIAARVMRVQMVDREPRYGLGLRFDEPQEELARLVEAAAAGGGDA
jgi:hypothetical protein